jgi:8-oxo-dGTP pyrophosphatase MutT (NUDIX family)
VSGGDAAPVRKVAACAVVFDDRGRVLLHRRADNGAWALPGGRIELDETAGEAVVREVREETGYDVEALRLVGVYSDPRTTTIRYPNGDVVCYVAVVFECRVVGGAPALSSETTELSWFDPETALATVHANHVQRIRDAMARRPEAFAR